MPPHRPPPTVVARLLRELRVRAALTQTAAGEKAGLPQTAVSRFESGRVVPSREQVDALAEVYGANDEVRAQLHGGSREADSEHRRVAAYRPQAARVQREYAELERESFRVSTFTPTVIPGLLQTDGYARALAGAEIDGQRLELWLDARRERRSLLHEPGREFVQIVGPGGLLWPLGGREVMAEQLDALIEASRLPSVELGVMPPGEPVAVHVLNGFDLYERKGRPPRVIVGTHASVSILDEPDDVAVYTALLEHLRGEAVWGERARAALEQLISWYR